MEKIAKTIRFPKEIHKAIQAYQKENEIASFTGALLELVRIALQKVNERG